ncbi:stAR-related lipid transfer protein 5-like [Tubulanus polymorphus]|uniref:stAR-related lipid transfer protein 5-like n=1 Tax=Tubulanus polymorphus TaxID=672921 RepID=UPI003DA1F61D
MFPTEELQRTENLSEQATNIKVEENYKMGPSRQPTIDELTQLAHETARKIEGYVSEDRQTWAKKKSNMIIVHSRSSTEYSGKLFVAESIINFSPETVFEFVSTGSTRVKWDKAIKHIETLEQLDQDLFIQKCLVGSQAGGAISSREFVDLVLIKRSTDSLSHTAVSIDYPACPPSPKCIRGFNHPLGIICSRIPSDPNKCRVTNIVQSDPCGKVPHGLIDTVMPSIVSDFFPRLEKALNKAKSDQRI